MDQSGIKLLFHCIDDSRNIALNVVWKVGNPHFPAWTTRRRLILEMNTAKSNTFRDCKTFTSHCRWNLPADEANTSKKRRLSNFHPITSENDQMKPFVFGDQIGESTVSTKFTFAEMVYCRSKHEVTYYSVASMMRCQRDRCISERTEDFD